MDNLDRYYEFLDKQQNQVFGDDWIYKLGDGPRIFMLIVPDDSMEFGVNFNVSKISQILGDDNLLSTSKRVNNCDGKLKYTYSTDDSPYIFCQLYRNGVVGIISNMYFGKDIFLFKNFFSSYLEMLSSMIPQYANPPFQFVREIVLSIDLINIEGFKIDPCEKSEHKADRNIVSINDFILKDYSNYISLERKIREFFRYISGSFGI